jgi:putative adhesin
MRSAIAVRLALGAAVAAIAASGSLLSAEGTIIAERSLPSRPGASLTVDTDHGGLEVQGENRDTIELEVTAEGIDPEEAKKLLDLTFEEGASGVVIRARFKKSDSWLSSLFGGGNARVHYDVRVPRATNLAVNNGSGGVRIDDLDGTVVIDNGSGGVEVTDINGSLSVDNGSGGVEVSRLRGALVVGNGSGGIDASEVTGDIKIDNGSGGVRLDGVDGKLVVETGSGGVEARMAGANAGIVATTSSGGVRISVPAGWGADVELSSSSGRIVLDGWKEASVGSAKSFRGQVGGGGPLIKMQSGSGNVELTAS